MILTISPLKRIRRRRAQYRAIEDRLRRYGETLTAPDDMKLAGAARVRAEFEARLGPRG